MGEEQRPSKRRRWPGRLLVGVLVFAALLYVGGGWYFSNLIDSRALDGAARREDFAHPTYDLTITGIGPSSIQLTPIGDGPSSLALNGSWGLRWDGGYGQVGDVQATGLGPDANAVERRFRLFSGTSPGQGTQAQLDPRAYPEGPWNVNVPYDDVKVKGPLGDYPAWYTDGVRDTWVILVHGNSTSRLDNVRMLRALFDAGYPTLTISYRNDPDTPEDPSGKLRYGLTEWADLEAAVVHAQKQGAKDVVLYGDSMGGGVIAEFLRRSDLAPKVRAVVFDAPMLDFSQTVDDNASRETLPVLPLPLPPSLVATAKWMAGWRFDVDWRAMDYLSDPSVYDVPFLVFHGDADTTVPIATSQAFAAARPDLVTLVTCPGANHIECWNVDRAVYEAQMLAFVKANTR